MSLGARDDSISEPRIEALFRPPLGEKMAMSTDGRFLAYTEHVRTELAIVIFDLERLERKTRIIADEDRVIVHSKERQRAELRFLSWGDGDRLVFAPSVETIRPTASLPTSDFLNSLPPEARPSGETLAAMRGMLEPKIIAPIMAVNADGTQPTQLCGADAFETPLPNGGIRMWTPQVLGFVGGSHRTELLLSVRRHDDPNATYRLNLRSGKLAEIHSETTAGHLAYDWQGQPRLQRLTERGDSVVSFLYRSSRAPRWQKFHAAPDAARFTTTVENYFGERAIPLGFDYAADVLIYASNHGRSTFGIYGLNLATLQRTSLAIEHPERDLATLDATLPSSNLVFDEMRGTFAGVRAPGPRPFTAWVDAELAAVQRELHAKFPRRSMQLLQWNEARTRFLARVTGGTEPGRIYLFRRPENLVVELMRRAPWLPNATLHDTRFIEFAGAEGVPLTGWLTLPRTPRITPPPLVIVFAEGLPPHPHAEFDPQAQVLADMGFVVCRLNQRGILGTGARGREALRHAPDAAPAADALAALEWIAAHHRIDRRRVATFGEGVGAYFAVRATQLHPDVFRCAVAIEPVLDLAAWVQPAADSSGPPSFLQETKRVFLESSGSKLHTLSAMAHADASKVPVFMAANVQQRNRDEQVVATGVAQLRAQLKRRGIPAVLVDLNDDYALGLPAARTRVYRELEEFFNLNLYHYDVKIGPARVVR